MQSFRAHVRKLSGSSGLGLANVRSLREQLSAGMRATQLLSSPPTVSIIGAPQQYGQPLAGTHHGPALLREAGIRKVAARLRWHVDDRGDVDMEAVRSSEGRGAPGSARHSGVVGAGTRRLYEATRDAHLCGNFVLTLGGDHSIALGSVAGALAARPETRVLWVDAHADANTPATSPSGNMHGMPLGFLLGLVRDEELAEEFAWLRDVPRLDPSRLAYVGLRDVDAEERVALRALRQRGCFVSSMHDVDRHGIGVVVSKALASLGLQHCTELSADYEECTSQPTPHPLHLSFDIDAVDPQIAPATGTVVRGGLSFREAHYVCEAAAATNALVSMDIVEVNDCLAPPTGAQATVELAIALTASALGDSIL